MRSTDRWRATSLRLLLLGLFVWMIRGILVPVVLGALFALLLEPVQRRLTPRLGPRARYGPLILTLGTIVLFVIPIALIGAKAVSSVNAALDRDWAQAGERVQAFLAERLGPIQHALGIGTGELRDAAQNLARRVASGIAGVAGAAAQALPGQLIDLFLFVLALYYSLRDGQAAVRWMAKLSPFSAEETKELFGSIHDTVNGAILGVAATSMVQGGLTLLALWILEVPGAFVLGVIATLMAFIPMIGTTPITVGSIVYLLASGRPAAAGVMVAAAVVIGISDNIVRPWVQSAQTQRVHPLVVVLGIFGGLQLFGVAGVFIGPVIAAMALWAVDTYAQIQLKQTREG